MNKVVNKPVKRKSHVGLIVTLIIVFVLVIFPVGFFFIAIFDTSTKDLPSGNIDSDTNIANTFILKSMVNTKDTKKIEIILTEDELNNYLVYLNKKANIDVLPKFYCEINENNYKFYVDFKWNFVQTRVTLDTTLDINLSSNSDGLIFKINSFKIGRLPIVDGLTNFILDKVSGTINDEKLNQMFGNFGIHANFDLKGRTITYTKDNIFNDAKAIFTKSSQDNFIKSFFDMIFKNEALFNISTTNGLHAGINLEPMHVIDDITNENYKYYEDNNKTINLEYYKGWIENLYANEDNVDKLLDSSGNPDKTKLNYVYQFFIHGYDEVASQASKEKGDFPRIKNLIDDLDFSRCVDFPGAHAIDYHTPKYSDALEGKDSYLGTHLNIFTPTSATDPELPNYIHDLIENRSNKVCSLSEEDVNNYLKSLNFYGYTFFIAGKLDKYVFNTITVEDINLNFHERDGERYTDDCADLFITININGYYITLYSCPKVIFDNSISKSLKFKFNKDEFMLGNVHITEQLADSILNLGKKYIDIENNDGMGIINDEESCYLDFDFEKIIENTHPEVEDQIQLIEQYIPAGYSPKFNCETSEDLITLKIEI